MEEQNKQNPDNGQNQSGRKLTKAEAARKERFDKLCADLERKGYRRQNITVSSGMANLLGMVAGIVPVIPFVVVFFILTRGVYDELGTMWYFLFLLGFLASIVIHELLHGTGWAVFAEGHFKSIAFGFIWQALMPYCTCKAPLRKGQYITGLLLPFIFLGIIPNILACVFCNATLLGYGSMMTVCAGGDLLIFVMILKTKLKGDVLFLDHPTDVGLAAFVAETTAPDP